MTRRGVSRSGFALLGAALLVACTEAEPETASGGDGGGSGSGEAGAAAAGEAPLPAAAGAGGAANDEPRPAGAAGEAGSPSSHGGESSDGGASAQPTPDAPYAHEVVSFIAGENAGYNADALPDIVLGPPRGLGNEAGSLDVLSLGSGGEIVLAFGNRSIVDGPGADFVVFENAFWPGGDASQVFAELAEVSVSEDGETWLSFSCASEGDGDGAFPGCAGWTPTLAYDAETLVPLDLEQTGGDGFDLAEVGLSRARFVKLRDLATLPAAGTNAGFDLDAVGIVNAD
jgi:hypothetical protein